MSVNLRFPNITAVTPAEQISQIKSYLHQLVGQLNWALSTLESGSVSEGREQPAFNGITEESFSELKSLIAQSTAMLDSYYEKINLRLEGQYVLQSDFQDHKEEMEERFEQQDGNYVPQQEFQEHTQAVWQRFDELSDQYVSIPDQDAYRQEVADTFARLDGKYLPQSDFQVYQQENAETMTALEESIAQLMRRIDAMEDTGGE